MLPLIANVLGPLIWRGGQHLTLGCIGLGILEGLIIARLLRVPLRRAIGTMILANFASAWLGALLLVLTRVNRLTDAFPLTHIGIAVILLTAFYFALSVAIEWNFVRRLTRERKQGGRLALRATLIAHVLTYGLIVAWYLPGISLLWRADRVEQLARTPASTARIYFRTEGGIAWMRLDGGDRGPVPGLAPDADFEFHTGERFYLSDISIGGRMIRRAPAPEEVRHGSAERQGQPGQWFLAIEGFGHAEPIAMELGSVFTPYSPRDATVVADDFLVVGLGERICLLDLRSLEIVELARGTNPVVATEKPKERASLPP